MDLSEKGKLLALGSALFLLGMEIEDKRGEMEVQYQENRSMCSAVILTMQKEFGAMTARFLELQDEFEKTMRRLEADGVDISGECERDETTERL